MKVKIIKDCSCDALEHRINKFLENQNQENVVEIKINTSRFNVHSDLWYAMVILKE